MRISFEVRFAAGRPRFEAIRFSNCMQPNPNSEKALVKRYSLALAAALAAAGLGASSVSAEQANLQGNTANLHPIRIAQATNAPPADFGSPPSGEVPILFNDHHVYSKPDRLKDNRVSPLRFVRGNEIPRPAALDVRTDGRERLRTIPHRKTADVSKPGSDVKSHRRQSPVIINGEAASARRPTRDLQGFRRRSDPRYF